MIVMLRIVFGVSCIISAVLASPPMCHCPNGGVGMQCPSPIQLNCPASPPCPSSPPCNMFGNLPTLPTLSPQGFQTFAPFTLAPLPGQQGFNTPPPPPPPLPLAVSPPTNGQETLVGINNPQQQYQGPQQQQQYQQPPQSQLQQPQPQSQQYPQQNVPPTHQYAEVPPQATRPVQQQQQQIPVQDSTTQKPSTLPSETYVELENPEHPPPVLQNVVDHVYESEPNKGYRQPVRRDAAPLNEKCNDDRLRRIIEENVDENPSTSKRKIQKAATDEIGGLFDVICSAHDFSYLANTQLFCEAGNDDVTCFAFLHSLIQ